MLIKFLLSLVIWDAAFRFESARAPSLSLPLIDGRAKRRLAQVGFGPGAPDHDLGHVLDVSRHDDLLLVLVADQSFLLEFVELIHVALGIDNTPVRIRSIRNHKVVGESEDTLA